MEAKIAFEASQPNSKKTAKINMNAGKLAHVTFIRYFCYAYNRQKQAWPLMKTIPKELYSYPLKNKDPPLHMKRDIMLWQKTEFSKIFYYDYRADTTELFKDFALAPEFKNWYQRHDRCAFNHLYNKSKPRVNNSLPKESLSTMKRYLTREENEAEIKIKQVNLNLFDEQDSTVIVCRKERELKEKGRSFLKQYT